MEADITMTLENVDFAPRTLAAEVMQNVRTIFATVQGSVPLDRLFGLDASMTDKPTPKAMAELSAKIVEAIHRWEPRCRVLRVTFDGDADGRLVPRARVMIHEA